MIPRVWLVPVQGGLVNTRNGQKRLRRQLLPKCTFSVGIVAMALIGCSFLPVLGISQCRPGGSGIIPAGGHVAELGGVSSRGTENRHKRPLTGFLMPIAIHFFAKEVCFFFFAKEVCEFFAKEVCES